MTGAHKRLSVHNVTFYGAPPAELQAHWAALGVSRLSILDNQLLDPQFPMLLRRNDYTVEAVYHLFAGGHLTSDPGAAREALIAVIDAAASVGAHTVYLLTGGRTGLTAGRRGVRVAPCAVRAKAAGVVLAVENASSLYADIHIAHTLRDTVALAEMSDLGICIDLFHCWAEGDFEAQLPRALPRTALIQLSDYVLGARALRSRRSSRRRSRRATPTASTWNSSAPASSGRAGSNPPGALAMSSARCWTSWVGEHGLR